MATDEHVPARRGVARRAVAWLRGVGAPLLSVAVVEYFLLPRLVEARAQVSLLGDISVPLMVVALLLEAASLAAYTCLTQVLLRGGRTLRFGTQLRIDLTGYGASHVVPGGGATAAALRYRLMVARGIAPEAAVSLTAVQTLLAAVALLGVATVGQVLTAARIGVNAMTVALVVAVLVVLTAGGSFLAHDTAPVPPRPVPELGDGRLDRARRRTARWWSRVVAVARQIREQLRRAPTRRRGLSWASANWVLDAACLWVCLAAYGEVMSPELVLSAYGVAGLLGLLPVTPGGLGVIEGTLVPGLVVLGGASGPVVLGVLTWRVLQFWLPVPVAAVTWLSLRLERGGQRVTRISE